jgi:hypothetical protein
MNDDYSVKYILFSFILPEKKWVIELMSGIVAVKVFESNPGESELFDLHMTTIQFDSSTGANLLGYFISQLDMSVLIDNETS